MLQRRRITHVIAAVAALATSGALLAGCSTSYGSGGMMGGTSRGSGGEVGGQRGMMGPGYSSAPLSCTPPQALPGARVDVTLGDMGMSRMMGGTAPMGARMALVARPASVPAGKVSFVVDNRGWRTHELVVLPLPAGSSAGGRVAGSDGKVDETGSLGEASSTCAAGAGEGIESGSVGWVTITLPPGHYELVCNLTNHYANGMHHELVVTG
ncbi:MAG TPA: sulfocyanin-like copper-binding protein [Ornithinibacter sp.]|nr:sulfocyanin-like copper-binding protein [Ornithinibacter sp.]